MLRGLLVTFSLAHSACSFLFVAPRPAIEHGEAVPHQCTEHYAAPVVDTTFAVASASLSVAALFALNDVDDDTQAEEDGGSEAGQFIATALLFGIATGSAAVAVGLGSSATYGYYHVARCRESPVEFVTPGVESPPLPAEDAESTVETVDDPEFSWE